MFWLTNYIAEYSKLVREEVSKAECIIKELKRGNLFFKEDCFIIYFILKDITLKNKCINDDIRRFTFKESLKYINRCSFSPTVHEETYNKFLYSLISEDNLHLIEDGNPVFTILIEE